MTQLGRLVRRVALLGVVFGLGMPAALAHDLYEDLDELMVAFEWDFKTAEVRSERVSDTLHVLFGVGGNIGVSIGPQGVLIVDDQFPEMMPKIGDAIRGLGGGSVDFAVNTHWHFDHAEGNLALGPGGTWLVSQANSRAMMLGDHVVNMVERQYLQRAYPETAFACDHLRRRDAVSFQWRRDRAPSLRPGAHHWRHGGVFPREQGGAPGRCV